jgi:hypothetical protein
MLELRVRNKLAAAEMEGRAGKLPAPGDWDVLLSGPCRVDRPDGRPLAIYLPGVLAGQMDAPGVYDILHSIQLVSVNRGLASGTPRIKSGQTRSYTRKIYSGLLGAVDPGGQTRYCRLTAWTGSHLPQWQALRPLLVNISALLAAHVPDRYQAQAREISKTNPAWVVPDTVFTTITVNNSYATGVHTDKGDLDAGFSCLAVLRRGDYTGGVLVQPQYRVGVDMGHGDLLLMDAHEWHGNTQLACAHGPLNGPCKTCGAERISLVAYFRTKLTGCGTPEEEHGKAEAWRRRTR